MRARFPGQAASRAGILALTLFAAPAWAQDDAPLLLEIWINGDTRHDVASLANRDGDLWMSADDLAASNIKVLPGEKDAEGLVDISRLSGIKTSIIDSEQRLEITADNDRIVPQSFDLRPAAASNVTPSSTGFSGSYDITSSVDDLNRAMQTSNGGAQLGGTLFGPWGTLTADGFDQSQTGLARFTRLDTAAEFDQPDKLQRITVGDAISGSQSWSRSVRMAGLQIATDFTLRPDLTTLPLPAFFGQTAVPATIDVFVNAARVFESNVQQGPFEINNLPILTGSGQASVVVRDVLGQETVATIPFFATTQLLQKDLEAYDFDIGMVRQNYGVKSFDYAQPSTMGAYSKGVEDWLTLQAHGEASQYVQLAGGGAVVPLGPFGAIEFAAAGSAHDDTGPEQSGALASLSMQSQFGSFGLFGSLGKTFGSYTDIAGVGSTPPPEFQSQFGANFNFGMAGSIAASWIETDSTANNKAQLITSSYTLSLGNRWNFAASGFYDMTNRSLVSEAVLTFSFGNNYLADTTLRHAEHAMQEEADFAKSVNPDGGLGYRLSSTSGDNRIQEADGTWIGSHGRLDGALSSTNGDDAGRLTASGGIVAMGGSVYATQYPDGAVALVQTGQPDARIYRENRLVATADDNGEALLTGFTPFIANRISIDPRDFAMSTVVDTTEQAIVPGRQAGVVVDLTPAAHMPAIVILHREDGSFPTPGARVDLSSGGDPLTVGRNGEVFIVDLSQPVTGTVTSYAGSCRFAVAPPATRGSEDIPHIDPVRCSAIGAAP